MDDRDNRQSERVTARDGRGQRLAAALRTNLLRRKKQALARSRGNERDRFAESGSADAAKMSHDSAKIFPDKIID